MDQSVPVGGNPVVAIRNESTESLQPMLNVPTVLMATVDATIEANMRELLQSYPLKTIWAKGVEEVRGALARETVSACFCGFWLVDGTYRDVVRHLKRQSAEIPAIIVCEPACPHEYRDYLAALNIRAFDFICYPYRRADMDRILRAAFSKRGQLLPLQSSAGNPANRLDSIDSQSGLRKAG
jgi:DNA-binding NtrC family response regulator